MQLKIDRRGVLAALGSGLIASGLGQNGPANTAVEATLEPASAKSLRELTRELVGVMHRRDFKAVPIILEEPDLWDSRPLEALLAYNGGLELAWDNTDLTGPWLSGIRNLVNSQVWSFKEPNFLYASATHGSAHHALCDQQMWDKYQLAKLAGGRIDRNRFIEPAAASGSNRLPIGRRRVLGVGQQHRDSATARRRVLGLPQHDLVTGRATGCWQSESRPTRYRRRRRGAHQSSHCGRSSHARRCCHAGETTTIKIHLRW